MSILTSKLVDRLLFTCLFVGLIASLYGGYRVVDISRQLDSNIAQQMQEDETQFNIQSSAQGRALMSEDLERRRLLKERGQMIIVAGAGVILIGVGWLGNDFRKSRRRRMEQTEIPETDST